jgi:hypothetical protein
VGEHLIDGGSGPRVEGHCAVEDVHKGVGHLREHLLEPFFLSKFQTAEVLFGVLIRKELHFLIGGFAQGGEDHCQLIVSALGVAVWIGEAILL